MKNIQRELKRKRTNYVIGLINQFKESDEPQTAFNCYEYVLIEHEYNSVFIFQAELPDDERTLLNKKIDVWFICFESFNTFQIFLQNQGISFESE